MLLLGFLLGGYQRKWGTIVLGFWGFFLSFEEDGSHNGGKATSSPA